ncbi:MAG: excinuclease ABC subunit UvrC [Alphaproteobacteria bacterium]|nr:excinuclease ABC subunit UvrC [Alphaproteobacteria bacterium]
MSQNSDDILPPGVAQGAAVIRAYLKDLPGTPGVYRMIDAQGKVLYVGKALSLKKRVTSYTLPARLPQRLQRMIAATQAMEFVHTRSEAEALLVEANLIKTLHPHYNILMRDGKSFPAIFISTAHDYPQVRKHRGARKDKGLYYGPFASAGAVNATIATLQRVFMLRNCSDNMFASRTRPCLQYHIKRCTAPCVDYVSKDLYAQQVRDARDFLEGRSRALQQRLQKSMAEASATEDYEAAAALRDKLRALRDIQAHQALSAPGITDADILTLLQREGKTAIQVMIFRAGQNYGNQVFFPRHDAQETQPDILGAFIAQLYENKTPPPLLLLNLMPAEHPLLEEALSTRAGRKVRIQCPARGTLKRLLDSVIKNNEAALARHLNQNAADAALVEKLAGVLGLPAPPRRIEIYDNSHLGGTRMVGAMVVAGPDGFHKKAYRTFNIRQAGRSDDPAMMREVLSRRLKGLDPQEPGPDFPDLLLIDGGKGQLNAVLQVLRDMGFSAGQPHCVAIAKGEERNAGRETLYREHHPPLNLPVNDPVLHYLQRLRDEAHRFVIGAQRRKRQGDLVHSVLDEIPGIGTARKKALLRHFGSAQAAARASAEEIAQVPGISKAVAQRIADYFQSG